MNFFKPYARFIKDSDKSRIELGWLTAHQCCELHGRTKGMCDDASAYFSDLMSTGEDHWECRKEVLYLLVYRCTFGRTNKIPSNACVVKQLNLVNNEPNVRWKERALMFWSMYLMPCGTCRDILLSTTLLYQNKDCICNVGQRKWKLNTYPGVTIAAWVAELFKYQKSCGRLLSDLFSTFLT